MLAEQRYKILFIQYVKEHLILTFYTTSYRLGEDIYLTGYDVTKGNESEYCILQVVKQPWKYIIVAGILMMLAGAILLFINGPKTDDKLG